MKSMHSKYLVILVCLIPIVSGRQASAEKSQTQTPEIMLNEDGDLVFFAISGLDDPTRPTIERGIRQRLNTLLDTPVNALIYNAAIGSDIMHYPSKAGSNWGWRVSQAEREDKAWRDRVAVLRRATKAGLDSVRVAGDWAKQHGLKFYPSYRINDGHYAIEPRRSALTGEFWVNHGQDYELGKPLIPAVPYQAHLLDFSFPEVRAYRMGIMLEIIDRYQDVMDGLQIDFMRNPILFPKGTAEDRAHLITEMIQKLRQRLDEVGQANGRSYQLLVRVPPTLSNCEWAGLEVARWIQDGLVDVVLPSPAMTLSHDIPMRKWVKLAKSSEVRVIPTLLDRTQFVWPLVADPNVSSYAGIGSREPGEAIIRGAIRDYLSAGAAGFELYNYNVPLNQSGRAAIRALADPMHGKRIYTVTPHFWVDYSDTFEPAKKIPAPLKQGLTTTLPIDIGENPAVAHGSRPPRAVLRLGLRAPDLDNPAHKIAIQINGTTIYHGMVRERLTAVTGRPARHSSAHPDPPSGYFQVKVKPTLLRQGHNTITLRVQTPDPGQAYSLVEVQIGLIPGDGPADPATALSPPLAN